MKCSMCKTTKPMGSTHVIDKNKQVVPSWLCSSCGCNRIKTFDELYQIVIDMAEKIDYTSYNSYVVVDKDRYQLLLGDIWAITE